MAFGGGPGLGFVCIRPSFSSSSGRLMLALVAELSPLGQVVGPLMEDVDLAVGAIGTHNILLDRFADADLFDEVVQLGERIFHSCGGITLTMPDFMPYESILPICLQRSTPSQQCNQCAWEVRT